MATEVKQVPEQTTTERTSEDRVVDAARNFWAGSGKIVIYVLVGLVVVIGGIFVYNNYFKAPQEAKAADAIWKAEDYFRQDSFNLALNGDGANQGFLKAIQKYGSTKTGNLAKFYAGACYLQLGDFNNAVKYLKEFSTDMPELKVRATGLLGDAYSELGKTEDAISEYKKAGNLYEDDDVNSPEYLYRAAMLYDQKGNKSEAIATLQQIKEKYPNSQRAFEADKYLGKLGQLP